MKRLNKSYIISFILILLFLCVAFSHIFSNHLITGGDYSVLSKTYLQDVFEKSFYAWNDEYNLGQNNTPFMNYAPYRFLIGVVGNAIQFNGVVIERMFWWLPFFTLAFVSSFYFRRLLPIGELGFLSTFFFIFNSYTLMLLGGGQISGVGLAFAIAPLVLVTFIELVNKRVLKNSLMAGLLFAVQVMFDLRIAYVTMFAVLFYTLLNGKEVLLKNTIKNFLYIFIIPAGITLLLHAFWILPILIFKHNPVQQVGAAFNSLDAVSFFSFATFENSLALLHPNWPENIFGKVGFMRAEFLILPILAFSSLFFIRNEKNQKVKKHILFFALLGLVGAFLAKGVNEPFGGVYLWMFEHVPGFVMFRDPTKWYVLVVISYSILIPYSVWNTYIWLRSRSRFSIFNFQFSIKSKIFNAQNIFLLFVFCYLLFLIRPVFLGQLGGTFRQTEIPQEYTDLNNFLNDHSEFYRTLWIPTVQKYGLHSSQHPAIYGQEFFRTSNAQEVVKKLYDPKTKIFLQNAGVKYIILPFDSESEIFVTDRKYDDGVYLSVKKEIKNIDWLQEKKQFGKIIIYEMPNYKERFWSEEKDVAFNTRTRNPTHYQIAAKNGNLSGTIIFSEQYDHNWIAIANGEKIASQKHDTHFNSFQITKAPRTIDVYYSPQRWVEIGIIISISTLVIVLIYMIRIKRQ